MTISDLVTLIRQNYNATDDSFFSDSEIYGLIYRAQTLLARKAFLIESTYSTTSVSGTAEYAFPTNAFSVFRVEYNGVKLQKVTKREEDSIRFAQTTTPITGTPRYYSEWDSTVKLIPAPDNSSTTISLFTYNTPSTVTVSSTLEVPLPFHDALADFVLSYMYAKDQNQGMSQYHMSLWNQAVDDAILWNKKRKRGDSPAQVQSEENLEVTVLGLV